jgi:tetratricopeptide (TPR) repeat protein
MLKQRSRVLLVLAALTSFLLSVTVVVNAQSDAKKAEILQKIAELEKAKAKLNQQKAAAVDKNQPEGKNLQEIVARYLKLLENCNAKKSERCADVIYTLGGMYYELDREDFIKAKEAYEERMDAYDKNPRGPEPVNPIPKYDRALSMYERLAKEYPDFPKLSEAYYQMGNIYLLMGDLDNAKKVFTMIAEKFPGSPRASGANFRLSDLCYLDHDNVNAIKHLEKIKENEIDLQTWEMVHYRKGEVYYNMGDFDKAINLFYTYVEKCDGGLYQKKEFRDMALEYMGIAYSDMGNGAQEAMNFFRKVGHKPYEDYVLYTIGLKNRTHGQFDDAILALSTALKNYEYYKSAPAARMALIECYVVKKEHEKANAERERLVDDYVPGSAWYNKNKNEKAAIDGANQEVRRALGHIAIYYHALAQKKKDKDLYQKALKRYQEFFTKFPAEKWRIFEFKYNVAEIYSALGDCEKAAENYNFVAMENLATYPPYQADIDTLGVDHDEVEKMKQSADKATSTISQEDAGYNVVVALDNCRKKKMASEGLAEDKAYDLVETKKLLDFSERFQAKYPKSQNAAEVLYLAGNIHYSAKNYDAAVRVFKQIGDSYPDAKIGEKAVRMLANSYSSSGQYDLAMGIYRKLLAKQKTDTPEYIEILDLAAGSLYKRAESIKKGGNISGAIEAFKAIATEYPTSKVADRGWFDAGVAYEEAKNLEMAASTFENFTTKFPKSPLRENAFIRSAEDYKKNNQLDKAAQIYQTGANNIIKAEFAIPSLSSASECYQKLGQFDMAGKMFELIYERYSSDPKTPQALYNAGLIFEKGKLYPNAINVYDILAKRFPESEYAAEAFFSIGLCYEKMGQNLDMANVFTEYANKYASDRVKQVQALVKAGDAFLNLKRDEDALKNFLLAVSIYEKFNKETDIDIESVAQAYYKAGEVYFNRFQAIPLNGRSERDIKEQIKNKTKALEDPAKYFAKVIELGIAEWTLKGTYMVGMGFVDMASAIEGQTLLGSAEEKIASKIRILSSLEKYYDKGQEYFYKNIDWAHGQNIKGDFVDKSIDKFMEMMYLKGKILESVGDEFAKAPIPRGLSEEEKQAYKDLLTEKKLAAQDAALPKYEEGIKVAKELGIAKSQWLDKIRERIQEISPTSEMLKVEIQEWVPTENKGTNQVQNATVSKADGSAKVVSTSGNGASAGPSGDDEYDRNMRRISNIINMAISVEDKVKQLNRIEMDAKRNIVLEEEKVNELKSRKN